MSKSDKKKEPLGEPAKPEGYKLQEDKKHFQLDHERYGSVPKKTVRASQ